jgi:autotransporter strand-loop-strand O-heptosyltransferase
MKKNVLILFQSNALGDNIAWVPYVEEYRITNNCNVTCAGYFNHFFIKSYPNITFVSPPDIDYSNFDLVIPLGYYIYSHVHKPEIHKDLDIHQDYNLQEYVCMLLRLKYKEIKPKIHLNNKNFTNPSGKPYVAIATHSTSQCKFWNYPKGWEQIIDYLNDIGYDVFSVDRNNVCGSISYLNQIPQNVANENKSVFSSLEDMANVIYNADFFIGLGSGMSWLAWALGKKVIMISGFSNPKIEFSNPYRVFNNSVCNSCFNNKKFLFDQSDWIWCPEHKNTSRIFECSKSITPEMVKDKINQVVEDILFDKLDQQIFNMNYYSDFLNKKNLNNNLLEINPGKGAYTKIFSKYFKEVLCISPKESQLGADIYQFKNVKFFKKSEFTDFLKIEFVYINIDRQTDFKIFKDEIDFWKTKRIKAIGGHGWSKDYIKKAVLTHFPSNEILIFNNDSWYFELPRS